MTPIVPRRIALRIWITCLSGHANELRSRASSTGARRAHRRAGEIGLSDYAARVPARLDHAARFADAAKEVQRWLADPLSAPRGGDLRADVVALAAAAILGDGDSVKALAVILRSIPPRRPGVIEDPAAFLRWVSDPA